MEKLIMVALKFKANLRSSMSGLLTSSVEWWPPRNLTGGAEQGRSDCVGEKKNFPLQKINSGNRYLIYPSPIILYLMSAETLFSNQDMDVYYIEIERVTVAGTF